MWFNYFNKGSVYQIRGLANNWRTALLDTRLVHSSNFFLKMIHSILGQRSIKKYRDKRKGRQIKKIMEKSC